ncbi:MAG: hypothetical protein FGF50_08970 [Candidatus Brockarchaeota archaeon]|nr:hypothetical protein [Candidatus Brockarchaeota archaeon]
MSTYKIQSGLRLTVFLKAQSLEEAINEAKSFADGVVSFITLVTGVGLDVPKEELAYEITPEVEERDFLQVFYNTLPISISRRTLDNQLLKHFIDKLTIELVPSTVWFSSLYNLMPEDKWRELKKQIYEEEGECYICGSTESPFELHEFWEYDDKNHVQKLIGVHHLCRLCHMIKHIGFWCHTEDGRTKLKQIGLSREDLIKHFCKVNQCSEKDFLQHEDNAFKIWRERSKHQWRQNFSKYKNYIDKEKVKDRGRK